MTAAIRSELRKLVTVRTPLVFAVATAGFVLLAVTFQAVAAGGDLLGPLDDPATQQVLFGSGGVATIVTVVFGALGLSGEFRHRSIVTTLLATPHRHEVVVAKAVVATLAGAAIGAVAVLAALLGTSVALLVTGTPTVVELGPLAGGWAGTALAGGLGSLVGFGIGGVLRNQAAAVGGVLLLLLAVEPLIGSLLPDLAGWLPSGLGAALADPSAGVGPGGPVAAAVYLAYGVALAGVAAVVLHRTDVS